MADEVEKAEEKPAKLQSRKFLVWVVWLVLTLIVGVVVLISCIKNVVAVEKTVELFEAVLKDFFYISAFYLGANFGQKAAFAISDALASKNEEGLQ